MPVLYEIHWTLAAGSVGQWTLGIVALIWTVDGFIAFYLTLPRPAPGFWRRWKEAWRIKRGAGAFRLNFDLHRAGGLWLWPLLLVFAWSSVMMDIRPVYEPVMGALFDYVEPFESFLTPRPQAADLPLLGWDEAEATGRRLAAERAPLDGFTVGEALSLAYFPPAHVYMYDFRGSRDVFERSPKGGSSSVIFDASSGALVKITQPTGEHLGNTIESWLYALHMARVFGLPYRILVSALGIVIVMLCVTGVYIWWRKQQARRGRAAKLDLLGAGSNGP
jgi:uncharacterized iron-regulated membrane protein